MKRVGEHTAKVNEGVDVQEARFCLLCGTEGMLLYQNLRDRLYDAPGTWTLMRCPRCSLIWLNPRPNPEEINKLYHSYFTHGNRQASRTAILQERIALPILAAKFGYHDTIKLGLVKRLVGRILSSIPLFKDMARLYVMSLNGHQRWRLLDVGCGDGRFLSRMKRLGWDVEGVEPDVEAVKVAEQYGLSLYIGTLNDVTLPPDSFDAITMRHVIEHLDNPILTLRECHRILKPGGRLIILTPNIDSLGHRFFKASWRELEPPRHLHLFSIETLQRTLIQAIPDGFYIEGPWTISSNAGQICIVSRYIQKESRWTERWIGLLDMIEGIVFLFMEELIRLFNPKAGEEILLIATKKPNRVE